ncbi:hypothetical protein Mpt1_c11540 [Candidatus Methanoplasma termitum]|uniref:Uncharacterized protein n=1 Tax=Candidatus Methanoplasma termitum TaxID=1577791 RepID=A0A0A7LHM9_9ARCH|nr:hypothetical protein [Candidatus Methanoplasma termitum]AIZ57016.1 hypothetical protein Mpt1_c11540 [Candidatus Methanoplasma termitum]
MRTNAILSMLFVIVLGAVLIGEVYVYTFNTGGYSSDVSLSGNEIDYGVTSHISTTYSIIITDNGNFSPNTSYYIYYDESYASKVNAVEIPVGAKALTEDYYISQLVHMLDYRGITNIEILNARELEERLSADTEAGTCAKGLIVLSGALPDTVYTGQNSDIIFSWLNDGGRLYWAGNLLGRYVSTPDGITDLGEKNNEYQVGFFGTECLNTGETTTAYSDVTDNEYRFTLSMMNNNVKYGVDTSALPLSLHVGYTEGGYYSTVLTAFGTNGGMICVLGGDYSSYQRHDLAQVISSGLSPSSVMIGHATGDLKRTTLHGTIEIGTHDRNVMAYVYYGGYFPTYGRLTELNP